MHMISAEEWTEAKSITAKLQSDDLLLEEMA
jgi:hypothetical protein